MAVSDAITEHTGRPITTVKRTTEQNQSQSERVFYSRVYHQHSHHHSFSQSGTVQ